MNIIKGKTNQTLAEVVKELITINQDQLRDIKFLNQEIEKIKNELSLMYGVIVMMESGVGSQFKYTRNKEVKEILNLK